MSFNQPAVECIQKNPLTFIFTLYYPDLPNTDVIKQMWQGFKSTLDQADICFQPESELNRDKIANMNLYSSAFRTPSGQEVSFRQQADSYLNSQKTDQNSPLMDYFILDEVEEKDGRRVTEEINRVKESLRSFGENEELKKKLATLLEEREKLVAQIAQGGVNPEQEQKYQERLQEIDQEFAETQQKLEAELAKTETDLVELQQKIQNRQQELQTQLAQIEQERQSKLTAEEGKFKGFQEEQVGKTSQLQEKLDRLDAEIQRIAQQLGVDVDLSQPGLPVAQPQPTLPVAQPQPILPVAQPQPTLSVTQPESLPLPPTPSESPEVSETEESLPLPSTPTPLPPTPSAEVSDPDLEQLANLVKENTELQGQISQVGQGLDLITNYNFLGQPISQNHNYVQSGGGNGKLLGLTSKTLKNCQNIGQLLQKIAQKEGGEWVALAQRWTESLDQPTDKRPLPTTPPVRQVPGKRPPPPVRQVPGKRPLPTPPVRQVPGKRPPPPVRRAQPKRPLSPPPKRSPARRAPGQRPPPPARRAPGQRPPPPARRAPGQRPPPPKRRSGRPLPTPPKRQATSPKVIPRRK